MVKDLRKGGRRKKSAEAPGLSGSMDRGIGTTGVYVTLPPSSIESPLSLSLYTCHIVTCGHDPILVKAGL